ncbi:acyl carrier protein [Lacrimispora algidixylanolytica]|uniref:Carrier domain-containing protein n=1 Tax=Lacrimispora algidixylanolytica TaxID=94868 RepID=A0A419SYB8_9FIRM|nr:phosphopantetheine-binding protein [Lacrimispora algidixylanolytica]RKD30252.1 hypothetical protein BET01_06560 [Lacrimispora algidixylanolytica]
MIEENNTQKEKVLSIISKFIEVDRKMDFNLIESIMFVKMILELEETFHIEFEDEMLSAFKFSTVDSFIEYVIGKLINKN